MRGLIPSLLAVLALGSTAFAADKPAAPGISVEMPYLIAPLTVDDKLVAYAYVSSKIIATSPSGAIEIRLKTPFLQDAFVRDVNAAPIGRASDPSKVDEAALVARLLRDTKRVMGAGVVADFRLIQIQIAAVRPNAPS